MRQPTPWLRASTGSWYVCIDGKQHPLGKDKTEAFAEFHRLMTERTGVVRSTRNTVREIIAAYLSFVESNRAESTHKRYSTFLDHFASCLPAKARPHAVRPLDVQRCLDKHYKNSSTTYQSDVITAIKGMFNWAESMGVIDRNPVAKMAKPRRNTRELFVPSIKWTELLEAASDVSFREYLIVALSSGARPHEMRTMQASYVDGSRVVFPRLKSKGKKRQRVIYLDSVALAIVQRRMERFPVGPIFRNRSGRPWTKDAVACRFKRLQEKMKMPGLCATVLRHSYTHQKLTSGVDSLTLAKLLGHVDTRMIATRYGHLDEAGDYLAEQAATGNPLANEQSAAAAAQRP